MNPSPKTSPKRKFIAVTKNQRTMLIFSGFLLVLNFIGLANAAGQSDTFMEPNGPIAAEQKDHLIKVTLLTMIAILPVFVLLPWLLVKFRRKSGNKTNYQPKWEHSLILEILMWGVPIVLVTIMSVVLWRTTCKNDPYNPIESPNPTIKVQVIGLDWKWLFIYPELGVASVGEFAIPVDYPITIDLTSDTVMQSFAVPALAGQIYTMPGMRTKLNFLATEAAEMQGENTQYNGEGFVDQKFSTIALPPGDFEKWVKKVRENGIPLDSDTYRILAKRSSSSDAHSALSTASMPATALYFTLPDSMLFGKVMARYSQGKAIPANKQPGSKQFDLSESTNTKEN